METLENQLMEAIRDSKIDVVQYLIDKGVNINNIQTKGKSPLSTAAALGNVPIMRMILNVGKTSNKPNQCDFSSKKQTTDTKVISCFDDDKENQNNCLSYGKGVSNNSTSAKHKQNLGYYIFVHSDEAEGNEIYCEGDVNKNENLDAETPEGMDGLEWDVEVEGVEEEEPDDVWSSQYRWYADILDKTGGLVGDREWKCDLNLQDYTGRCALHYAVEYCQLEALNCLISAGCKIDIGDVDNLTPLHLAAMRNHCEIAKLLIDRGANVNRKTTDKMAPLHYAAVRGFTEMVTILIQGGASVDSLDANDRTPLMLAVTRHHLDVVKLLVSHGAKVNIEEIHGYTPLCEAVWNKQVDIANVLLKAGAKLTQSQHLLHFAVQSRQLAMAEHLLMHGAYPNLRDDNGDTPLILAVNYSQIDMVKLLLRYDANPNYANSLNCFTPIHAALTLDTDVDTLFDEVLRLLCLHNVDLNAYGGGSFTTPLTTALEKRQISYSASLICAGADVNKSRDATRTAWGNELPHNLDLALRMYEDSLCYLVVAAGFDMQKFAVDLPKDSCNSCDPESCIGYLLYMKYNPRRLTDLCRLKIRSQMGSKALYLIPALEIPQSLKQFLLFKDIYVEKYSEEDRINRRLGRF